MHNCYRDKKAWGGEQRFSFLDFPLSYLKFMSLNSWRIFSSQSFFRDIFLFKFIHISQVIPATPATTTPKCRLKSQNKVEYQSDEIFAPNCCARLLWALISLYFEREGESEFIDKQVQKWAISFFGCWLGMYGAQVNEWKECKMAMNETH